MLVLNIGTFEFWLILTTSCISIFQLGYNNCIIANNKCDWSMLIIIEGPLDLNGDMHGTTALL